MFSTNPKHTFVLFLLLLAGAISAQHQTLPYNKWIDQLSVKTDLKTANILSIRDQLVFIDTVTCYNALVELGKRGMMQKSKRFDIRFNFLKILLAPCYVFNLEDYKPLDLAKEALRLAYEIEDEFLIASANKFMAGVYKTMADYGMAIMHQQIYLEHMQQLGEKNFVLVAFDWYALGELLYHARQYEASINALQLAIAHDQNRLSLDTLEITNKIFLYNTLGLAYEKSNKYDSAFIAFDKALHWAIELPSPNWVTLIEGNRGDIFYHMGQYDSASVLLQKDVVSSLAGGKIWADNAANSMQLLARISTHRNDPASAINQLREAEKVLQQLPNPQVKSRIYYAYLEAFEKLGRADSVYAYTQKYLTVHDSLEHAASNAREEIVAMRLQNQDNIQKVKLLNKERRQIVLIRNFSIALTLLAFAFGILYLNREKLRMKIKQQKILDEKRKAEEEASAAKDRLDIFTQNVLEKNNLVERLQSQLMQKEVSDQQRMSISELSQHSILTDADWDHFKSLFEKVYPGFFHDLKTKAPDITVAEQRIAALSKLKVSSKDAANLLGISPASVNKTRQRLRYRLELDNDVDLEVYFAEPGLSPDNN